MLGHSCLPLDKELLGIWARSKPGHYRTASRYVTGRSGFVVAHKDGSSASPPLAGTRVMPDTERAPGSRCER